VKNKNLYKVAVLVFLLFVCLLATYYCHFVLRIEIIFTHLFYVPIILASLWWSRKGIAVNPDTPLIAEDVLSSIDFLVIMGVYPGFGGAPFEESTFDHVRRYDALRKRTGLPFEILVDGGVGKDNIVALKDSGADHFVVGSGVFKQRPRESFIELEHICDTHD